eukprot:gene24853-10512_t
MQHWFMIVAQYSNESDRYHGMDGIPHSLRRANPNMTREYYLKHRASPSFLLNTAYVCPKAASELNAAALEDITTSLTYVCPKAASELNAAALNDITTSLMYVCPKAASELYAAALENITTSLNIAATQRDPGSSGSKSSKSSKLPRGNSSPSRTHRLNPTPGSTPKSPPQITGTIKSRLYDPPAERGPVPLLLKPKGSTTGTAGTASTTSATNPRRSAHWAPRGLSGRSTSPFRSPSRNPVSALPRLGTNRETSSPQRGSPPQQGENKASPRGTAANPPTGSDPKSAALRPSSDEMKRRLSSDETKTLAELNAACGAGVGVDEPLRLPKLSGSQTHSRPESGAGAQTASGPSDGSSASTALPPVSGSRQGSRPPSSGVKEVAGSRPPSSDVKEVAGSLPPSSGGKDAAAPPENVPSDDVALTKDAAAPPSAGGKDVAALQENVEDMALAPSDRPSDVALIKDEAELLSEAVNADE